MIHTEWHPLAGQTVPIRFAEPGHFQIQGLEHVFRVEDWADRVMGKSWMLMDGNPACLIYAMRSGRSGLPINDKVLYGKIGPFGHLIHESELVAA